MREFKKLPLELFIGYDIEQNSRVIELDASEMVEKYPSGILQLVCKRPGEETTYIAPSFEQDGGTLRWTLTSYDVEKAGQGLAIVALVDTSEESVKVLASHKIRTGIEEGLHFRDAETVDPEDSLIARVLAAVSQAQAYAQDAKEEADRAEAAGDAVEDAKDQAIADIETKGAETLASIPSDYTALSGDVSDLKSAITNQMTLKESTNHSVSDASWISGYYIGNGERGGNPVESSTYSYSDYIPVEEGDIVRLWDLYAGTFEQRQMFTVTAYDTNKAYVYKGDAVSWKPTNYTVQSGIAFVRISTKTATNYMVTINNDTVTAYEPYHEPYYVAQYGFIDDALSGGELKLPDLKNEYAVALPKTKLRQTVGIAESWYKSSMITPPTDLICVNGGYSLTTSEKDCVTFTNATADTSNNGYVWYAYDALFNMLYNFDNGTGYGAAMVRQVENLSDCSLLAIGDSTIDQDHITGKLLSYFTEKGKTITLLGTLGKASEPLNKNEGRAGWTTTDYMTNSTLNGYTNPFYNSVTGGFDFSYYMSQQGYSGVDFVVIQLGINDLYPTNPRMPSEPNYETIWSNIKTMIDSILAYNSGIKIIINLPTTPNSNPSAHRIPQFLYQHYVVRYNEIALNGISTYPIASVRPSYCHLILDPASDISDNVHPTVAGYEKMAMEIINQINCWQNGA